MQWSDPVRAEEFNSFVTNTSEVVSKSILKEAGLTMWQKTRMQQLHGRKLSRKRLKPETGKLGLTKEDADEAIAIKT